MEQRGWRHVEQDVTRESGPVAAVEDRQLPAEPGGGPLVRER